MKPILEPWVDSGKDMIKLALGNDHSDLSFKNKGFMPPTDDLLPDPVPADQPKILFTEEGHRIIGSMLDMYACQRGFLEKEEGIILTDEQGLRLLLAKNTRIEDDAEAILDALIKLTLRGNLNAINNHQDIIFSTWEALKGAREKAGRPAKVLV